MFNAENSKVLSFLVLTGVIVIFLVFLLIKNGVLAEDILATATPNNNVLRLNPRVSPIYEATTFLPRGVPHEGKDRVARKIKMIITGYSSTVWETQGNPFITASGKRVRDGIIANNLLPFGTKVKIPSLFGDKVFVVEDRMNSKKGYYHADIWFPSREQALKFGAKIAEVEVLEE
jgi:3D (Asp-Asp-Asp) domain-containing protein